MRLVEEIMMTAYVFFKKDMEVKIFEKNEIDTAKATELSTNGFLKIDIEINADDEVAAVDSLIKMSKKNENNKEEFYKDIKSVSFSSILESLLR